MRIVYYTYGGRYSDSPRAIHEELAARGDDHEHVWLTEPPHAHAFPTEGVRTVPYPGRRAAEELSRADAVVSNTHVLVDWEKAPGALYLQTWHGTPLKHIHYDSLWVPPGVIERHTADVVRWDVLLSPNAASTGPLRGAFGFTGPVLETGYPRNDVLSSPRRDAIRARVRRELGIADGTTAVLYTPTWRDDVLDDDGEQDHALHLDVAEFTARLGADHVLLLRLHPLVTTRREHAGVRDVSAHPDISELYLAADVMITDYSSTMFDFAITGKPLLFYTYDLEHYRDTLRGFYFDFEVHAPGPLLRTSTEVVDALADLEPVRVRYEDAYARFHERFCHLEDGRATQRVLDELFPEERERSAAATVGGGAR